MQMNKSQELREAWQKKGNPPCEHNNTEQEHYLGTGTGEYVCTQCGKLFSFEEISKRSG